MPREWRTPDGTRMIAYCLFCGGCHRWDINACPAPEEEKRIYNCKHCGGEHGWDIGQCPEAENTDTIYNCLFCGGDHEKDIAQCPARENVCERCQRMGHYETQCKRLTAAEEKATKEMASQ